MNVDVHDSENFIQYLNGKIENLYCCHWILSSILSFIKDLFILLVTGYQNRWIFILLLPAFVLFWPIYLCVLLFFERKRIRNICETDMEPSQSPLQSKNRCAILDSLHFISSKFSYLRICIKCLHIWQDHLPAYDNKYCRFFVGLFSLFYYLYILIFPLAIIYQLSSIVCQWIAAGNLVHKATNPLFLIICVSFLNKKFEEMSKYITTTIRNCKDEIEQEIDGYFSSKNGTICIKARKLDGKIDIDVPYTLYFLKDCKDLKRFIQAKMKDNAINCDQTIKLNMKYKFISTTSNQSKIYEITFKDFNSELSNVRELIKEKWRNLDNSKYKKLYVADSDDSESCLPASICYYIFYEDQTTALQHGYFNFFMLLSIIDLIITYCCNLETPILYFDKISIILLLLFFSPPFNQSKIETKIKKILKKYGKGYRDPYESVTSQSNHDINEHNNSYLIGIETPV